MIRWKEADPRFLSNHAAILSALSSCTLSQLDTRHNVNSSTIFKQGLADASRRVHTNLVQFPTQRMFFTVSTNLPAVPLPP